MRILNISSPTFNQLVGVRGFDGRLRGLRMILLWCMCGRWAYDSAQLYLVVSCDVNVQAPKYVRARAGRNARKSSPQKTKEGFWGGLFGERFDLHRVKPQKGNTKATPLPWAQIFLP